MNFYPEPKKVPEPQGAGSKRIPPRKFGAPAAIMEPEEKQLKISLNGVIEKVFSVSKGFEKLVNFELQQITNENDLDQFIDLLRSTDLDRASLEKVYGVLYASKKFSVIIEKPAHSIFLIKILPKNSSDNVESIAYLLN